MKRIAITGPTGAIGMALIELCIQRKIEVLAICHKSSKRIGNIPASELIKIVEADLADYTTLDEKELGTCDGLIHLAWIRQAMMQSIRNHLQRCSVLIQMKN